MLSPASRRDQRELSWSRHSQISSSLRGLSARSSATPAVPLTCLYCLVIIADCALRSLAADRASHSYQQMYVARSDTSVSSLPCLSSLLPRALTCFLTRAIFRE